VRVTIKQALEVATARLRDAGVSEARSNAELLLAELLEIDAGALFLRRDEELEPAAAERFGRWIERRAKREPFQHITGWQEFYGLSFRVDRHVLVPRPETEGLVDAILGSDLPEFGRVADLGTGSGCIAVAVAVSRSDLELFALDRSEAALVVARENAEALEVTGRIEFRVGDLASPPEEWCGTMHVVVSNPPYVSENEWAGLDPEVRDHDPRDALVPGPTGLEAYRLLVPAAFELLRDRGRLVLELGAGQADAVTRLVRAAGLRILEVRPDLNGIPRVLVAEKSASASEEETR
jgi:release factor glutamine methyltransferase